MLSSGLRSLALRPVGLFRNPTVCERESEGWVWRTSGFNMCCCVPVKPGESSKAKVLLWGHGAGGPGKELDGLTRTDEPLLCAWLVDYRLLIGKCLYGQVYVSLKSCCDIVQFCSLSCFANCSILKVVLIKQISIFKMYSFFSNSRWTTGCHFLCCLKMKYLGCSSKRYRRGNREQ